MDNFFARQATRFNNEMATSCGALVGIVQGLLADGHLNDREIVYLSEWLSDSAHIAECWPGNVIAEQIRQILADGVVSEQERDQLAKTLTKLIGGALDAVAASPSIALLALDDVQSVAIRAKRFVLTGDFAYGTRNACESLIEKLGGETASAVSKKVHYVVIGGLGSAEWKHGSFGTKVAKAMELKQAGASLLVVHEDAWVAAVRMGI